MSTPTSNEIVAPEGSVNNNMKNVAAIGGGITISGILGFVAYKLGVLDIILGLLIAFLSVFGLIACSIGIMSDEQYESLCQAQMDMRDAIMNKLKPNKTESSEPKVAPPSRKHRKAQRKAKKAKAAAAKKAKNSVARAQLPQGDDND